MQSVVSAEVLPSSGSESARFLVSDLCALLDSYLEPMQVREVYRAYLFGAEAHEGQSRMSGEPYIYHPIAVAKILADMRLDYKTVMAAILHDVIEDTPTAKDQLARDFGPEIADLVDGVSKLTLINFKTKAEAQAENFRKMLMAMAQDIRVILIKLADRLHNMRTLGALPPSKRRRIARETLEIYAPIANRLGINGIRHELEDLGFQAQYPMRYRVLTEAVHRARGHRKEVIGQIETAIKRRLRQEGLAGTVEGREKYLYSIYQKMCDKRVPFSEVYDVHAIRIVVDKVDTCYRVLGMAHNLYKPVPGRFKDYIAMPKTNGYQSLHTTLLGPNGTRIEVQIRTEAMHRNAESGIAAHWLYKLGDRTDASAQARAKEWLQGLLELQKGAGDSVEFLENVKVDLFPDEVYVFTPKGEIFELPHGATVLDFAYAVHSDVGNSCVAARIDRQLAPLRTPLLNGQTVEIITAPGSWPNPAWLDFAVTGKARANIRSYLKHLRRQEAIPLGRRMLDKQLSPYKLSMHAVPPDRARRLLGQLGLSSIDGLLEEIGLGNRSAPLVAKRLLAEMSEPVPAARFADEGASRPLSIQGTEGMVVHFAKCCYPIPGDPIVGIFSAGRGIVVHNQSCKNVQGFRKRPENWIEVQWQPGNDVEFNGEIRVQVANQRGVLASLASAISELDSNIENISIADRDGLTSTITLVLSVRDRKHLARIMRRLRAIRSVMHISRKKGT
jgi:guanosine-3',5'-bis(diphosphate) 3'-pyrophosphohydrolase